MEIKAVIQKALNALGEKGKITKLQVTRSSDRWIVEVDGKYFGIYDVVRKTFVD